MPPRRRPASTHAFFPHAPDDRACLVPNVFTDSLAFTPSPTSTVAAPLDALLALTACNASAPLQQWRLNASDNTLWTQDDAGTRWCVGPSELSWTRPLSVLPCDDPQYRTPTNVTQTPNCHVTTCVRLLHLSRPHQPFARCTRNPREPPYNALVPHTPRRKCFWSQMRLLTRFAPLTHLKQNYVSGFRTAPVQCVGLNASHCHDPDLGGVVGEGCSIRLQCKPGGVITGITFADFGLVTGEFGSGGASGTPASCSSFRSNASCTAEGAKQIVEDLCVGKQQCDVLATAEFFGDPCRHVHKRLAIFATGCSPDPTVQDPTYVALPSTIAGADSLTWENVEFGTGPLPHTRYVGGGTASSGYWTTSEAGLRTADGAMLQAGYGRVRDDDGTGHIRLADATQFCVEATRGGNLETWWAPLSGGRHAVALFNRSPSADVIAVSWTQLPGLQPTAHVSVRDVWLKIDAGIHTQGLKATVPAHGTSLFVLTPV